MFSAESAPPQAELRQAIGTAWVRLAFDTENGRSEILTSFHGIGREFRGLVGVSMCFYRRQPETPDEYEDGYDSARERLQVVEWGPVCDEVFQVSHMEPSEAVQRRFRPWMERALVLALDQWRRGEQPLNTADHHAGWVMACLSGSAAAIRRLATGAPPSGRTQTTMSHHRVRASRAAGQPGTTATSCHGRAVHHAGAPGAAACPASALPWE